MGLQIDNDGDDEQNGKCIEQKYPPREGNLVGELLHEKFAEIIAETDTYKDGWQGYDDDATEKESLQFDDVSTQHLADGKFACASLDFVTDIANESDERYQQGCEATDRNEVACALRVLIAVEYLEGVWLHVQFSVGIEAMAKLLHRLNMLCGELVEFHQDVVGKDISIEHHGWSGIGTDE